MNKYLKYPIKIILHNHLYWLLIMVVTFSTLFLGSIHSVSQSMSEAAYKEQREIFGGFQYIAYIDGNILSEKEFGENYIKELSPNKNIKKVGYIYKLGFAQLHDIVIDFGYLDEEAWRQSEAKILKGRLPEREGEVALSDTKIAELSSGNLYDVGDSIEVNGREFILTGIYGEFGIRWVGADSFRLFSGLDGLFGQEDAEKMWNQNNSRILTVLIDEKDVFSDIEIQDAQNIYGNSYITESYAANMYQLPGFLIPTICLFSFLLIGSIYLLIGEQRRNVNAIYLRMGMDKYNLRLIEALTFSLCNLVGFICGMIGSITLTTILLNAIGIHISPWDIHLNGLLFLAIVIYLQMAIAVYFIVEKISSLRICRKAKKTRFTVISLICTKFFFAFISLCSFTIIMEYSITSFYQIQYKTQSIPDNSGEMDTIQGIGYDFELRAVNTASGPPNDSLITNTLPKDGSGIYFYKNQMYFGISEENIHKINALSGVAYTKAYKENNTAMLNIHNNIVSDYIDASDFVPDGKYLPRVQLSWEKSIVEHAGLKDKLLVNSKLLGCPSEDLSALGKYKSEGDIDVDKLAQGEEVILVIPKFLLDKRDDGSVLMKRLKRGEDFDDIYVDDTFSVGDVLEFYVMQPDNTALSFGAISGRDVNKHFEVIQCKVEIGAIVYDYAGWFVRDEFAKPYTIVMHNDAFSKFGLKDTFTRLRIYTNEEASEDGTTKLMYTTYKDIEPYMEIENRLRSERIHKDYLLFLQIIKYIFISLAAVAFSALLSIYIILQVLAHKRTIGLLFLNGYSLKRLMTNLALYICKIWIGTMLLCFAAFLLLAEGGFGAIVWSINDKIMMTGVLFLVIQEIALIPCYWLLKKKSILELIRK